MTNSGTHADLDASQIHGVVCAPMGHPVVAWEPLNFIAVSPQAGGTPLQLHDRHALQPKTAESYGVLAI